MPFISEPVKKVISRLLSGMAFLTASALLNTVNAGYQPIDDSLLRIKQIVIEGNKITRKDIIRRELLFQEGDSVSVGEFTEKCRKTKENLLNTSLFNFVTLQSSQTGQQVEVVISVIERWYIWPSPIFELADRNFNTWWKTRDFSRVNYGFRLKWSNFRGRMENLDFLVRFGKNEHFSILYTLPYINKARKAGAGFEFGVINKREVGYNTLSDELIYLYNRSPLLTQWYGALILSYRGSIHETHTASFRLQHIAFADTLLKANPDYFSGGVSSAAFLSLYYKFKADHRDAKYYPLKGWYFDLELLKSGLGFGSGSKVDAFWAKSTSRLFIPLSVRFSFGGSITGKISSGSDQPYYFSQGMGFDRDYVRGYEYYVVDGAHYLISRNTLRYALIPQRASTIGFIPTQKFSKIHYATYLTIFGDAGRTWLNGGMKPGNLLPETLLLGAGAGLDFVTYYDKVIRIEYSVNKSGENGIFIHFIAGI